jgi:hypothetical protein
LELHSSLQLRRRVAAGRTVPVALEVLEVPVERRSSAH